MTEDDAISKLREMYENAAPNEMAVNIHLFGIKYADELAGLNLKNVARQATGRVSYHTEIRKGINLAKYVALRG